MTIQVTKEPINLREKLNELETNKGLKGNEILQAETAQEVRSLIGAGRKNLIINGDMKMAQRGTNFTNVQGYKLDRWQVNRYASSTFTTTRPNADLEGFERCIRIQRTSGNASGGAIAINQPLEQRDCFALKGKAVTASFWIRVGADYAGATDTLQAYISGCTDGTERSMNYNQFSNGSVIIDSIVVAPSNTWVKYTMTGVVPSNCNQVGFAVRCNSYLGTASTNDYFDVVGVQLELGSVATDFEHRSYGEELALCQRYYFQWSGSNISSTVGTGQFNSTTSFLHAYKNPVAMRVVPTGSYTGSVNVYQGSTGKGGGTITFNTHIAGGRLLFNGLTTSTLGGGGHVDISTAVLKFDAEL